MRLKLRSIVLTTVLVALPATFAPSPHAQSREGLMGELLKDIGQLETKVVGLAKAMPAESYAWRPADGVRSTGEVVMHIAADNYLLPALMGNVPPADTGIIAKDYKTAMAFEKKTVTKEQAIAELEKSFAFLEKAMNATSDEQLGAPLEFFGQKSTKRGLWVTTATHLHEHLGQLIAYARMNKVTPPWSKQ
jgi:uncharacterized damage-inducible protein DinB